MLLCVAVCCCLRVLLRARVAGSGDSMYVAVCVAVCVAVRVAVCVAVRVAVCVAVRVAVSVAAYCCVLLFCIVCVCCCVARQLGLVILRDQLYIHFL